MKSAPQVKDEDVLVALCMAPLRGLQRSYRHLSSVKGFGIVATVASVYCLGLSVETIYVAIPSAISPGQYSESAKAERRFIPKPFVSDGAKLARLNPWPNIQHSLLQPFVGWLPEFVKGSIEASKPYTIWDEPGLLFLSFTVAITIQRFEGLIWRRKSYRATLIEFQMANQMKQVQANPEAIALAQYKASQHNSQGLGGLIGTFFAVVVLYGMEIAAFLGSFAGSGNWAVNMVYGMLTIGGFEVFDRLGDGNDSVERMAADLAEAQSLSQGSKATSQVNQPSGNKQQQPKQQANNQAA